jgi:hypothetical protein
MANSNSKWSLGSIIGVSALVLSAIAVVVVLTTLLFGAVRGQEFDPQSFERRNFGFHEIPLLHLQVTPLWRAEANGELEQLIIAQKYVVPATNSQPDWQLISLVRQNSKLPTTDVQILARYLDAKDEDDHSYWTQWSMKHPEMAAILWPEVARLARLELYVLLPPLLELARNATEIKPFQADLKQLQTQQLQETVDRMKKRASAVTDQDAKDKYDERIIKLEAAITAADEDLSQEIKAAESAKASPATTAEAANPP